MYTVQLEMYHVHTYMFELEFACLSGWVRLVALALHSLDSTQPVNLPR